MSGPQNGAGNPPVLEVHHLSRSFAAGPGRKVTALSDVSIAVGEGEVVGILGPNGSGKTTLLDHLVGLLRPQQGSVRVLGLPPGHREGLARVGHLPQSSIPYPALPGRDLLRFTARVRGFPGRDAARRAEELLERLSLSRAGSRASETYSTGMERRLGLAVALLHRPRLLLLDEPTSGLDPEGSALVRGILAEEARQGVTILMTSHHLHEVEQICSRVLLLLEGRLAADRPLGDLLAAPGQRMLVAEGLDQPGWEQVLGAVAAAGGRLVRQGPAQLPLEEVYRRMAGPGGGVTGTAP